MPKLGPSGRKTRRFQIGESEHIDVPEIITCCLQMKKQRKKRKQTFTSWHDLKDMANGKHLL